MLVDRGPARPRVPGPLLRRLRRASSATCSARTTACPRRRVGRGDLRASAADAIRDLARRMAARAHDRHGHAGRCSARGTASSRSGWRSRWRRCSARSGCPAAGSATATARWATSAATRPLRAAAGPAARAATRCDTFIPVARIADMLLHPGRGVRLQRPAAGLPGHPAGVLGRRQPVPPPPGPGPAAARVRPARHGRRARAVLDADGAPRRHRAPVDHDASSATTSAARRDDPLLIAMHRRCRAVRARRATTTTIFAGLAGRLGFGDGVHRGPHARASGSSTCTTKWRDGHRELGVDVPASTSSGPRRVPAARRSPSAARCSTTSAPTRQAHRCARRAAGSRSSPRPSTASATPTAPGTRPGCEPAEWLGGAAGRSATRCT